MKTGIMKDMPTVENLLVDNPISLEDYRLMVTSSAKIAKALDEIRIEHREDLVVPFAIP